MALLVLVLLLFFFNDTATTEIYTLSLHDALPIYPQHSWPLQPWLAWDAVHYLRIDRKSTRLNSSHVEISYAVFCLKKKNAALGDRPDAPRNADHVPFHRPELLSAPTGRRALVLRTVQRLDVFFFNETATTDIYTLSLHDALPICSRRRRTKVNSSSPLRRDRVVAMPAGYRSEEHTSELQSRRDLVCRLLLEKKKKKTLVYILVKKKKKNKRNRQ